MSDNIYKPDRWQILEITNTKTGETIKKVLAGWGGGYLYGDSWRMSSGIESVTEDAENFTVKNFSGSTYVLRKTCQGRSGIMHGVYMQLAEQADRSNGDATLRIDEWKCE